MDTPKFTPGDWKHNEIKAHGTPDDPNDYLPVAIWADAKKFIATTQHSPSKKAEVPPEEAAANCRVMAASTALYRALKQTLDALYNETNGESDSPWIAETKRLAAAALDKAVPELAPHAPRHAQNQ